MRVAPFRRRLSPRRRRGVRGLVVQAPGDFSWAGGAGVSLAAEAPFWAAPSAFPSSSPFSNWFLAEPRLRASFGMAAPPKRRTTSTMATMSRSGPKISASMRFSFTRVHVAVNWIQVRPIPTPRFPQAGGAGWRPEYSESVRQQDAHDQRRHTGCAGDRAPQGQLA